MPHAALFVVQVRYRHDPQDLVGVSMPHAALFVVQDSSRDRGIEVSGGFNAARGFVCGASSGTKYSAAGTEVSMPHAALFVVQDQTDMQDTNDMGVSMPHAALFVVQDTCENFLMMRLWFQCRTRLCLWCKPVARSPCISCVQRLFWKVSGCLKYLSERTQNTCSNTTSLSGAISCAISPCHAHGRIGKSRRCSAALRRIPATFHFVLCTIYIIAETAPNDKYLCSRKKVSARGLQTPLMALIIEQF